MPSLITIPSDYTELTHPGVIPICIADTDVRGNPIYREWIDRGVVPEVDGLLKIAGRLLSNRVRASEIAEYAVHSLSRTHGENIGDRPGVKVLNRARLHAVNLRYGGRRSRRRLDVELFAETLDALEDQYDFVADLERKEIVDKLAVQLDVLELYRVKELLPSMLRDAGGREMTKDFGQKRNTLTTRFYRGMRKAAVAAGISWE